MWITKSSYLAPHLDVALCQGALAKWVRQSSLNPVQLSRMCFWGAFSQFYLLWGNLVQGPRLGTWIWFSIAVIFSQLSKVNERKLWCLRTFWMATLNYFRGMTRTCWEKSCPCLLWTLYDPPGYSHLVSLSFPLLMLPNTPISLVSTILLSAFMSLKFFFSWHSVWDLEYLSLHTACFT